MLHAPALPLTLLYCRSHQYTVMAGWTHRQHRRTPRSGFMNLSRESPSCINPDMLMVLKYLIPFASFWRRLPFREFWGNWLVIAFTLGSALVQSLRAWDIPQCVCDQYAAQGVRALYPWQAECLAQVCARTRAWCLAGAPVVCPITRVLYT